ncbi:hypothetical protein PUR71_02800, partial [Streptomyces sp. SP17BM10]|nr:hypothetical protein [Streptomyces sp. SP17BM10]
VLTVVTGDWAHLPSALGLALALLGCGIAVGSMLSVLAPYTMPADSTMAIWWWRHAAAASWSSPIAARCPRPSAASAWRSASRSAPALWPTGDSAALAYAGVVEMHSCRNARRLGELIARLLPVQ